MRRRGLHRVTGTAVLLAAFALLTSVSTASADVVHLKIKEGRTVLDPGTNTVIADQNSVVAAPYTWLLTRDVTGTPDDSAADCRPAHGLAVPSDVLKANGGNTAAPAYLSAVAAMDAAYANYPENCDWPSIHAIGPGTAPSVVMTGDSNDWSLLQGMSDLPNGKYMVSVWAEGYEVAGGWFEVKCAPGTAGCNRGRRADRARLRRTQPDPDVDAAHRRLRGQPPDQRPVRRRLRGRSERFHGDRDRSRHRRGADHRRLRQPDLLRLRADPDAHRHLRSRADGVQRRRPQRLPAVQRGRQPGVRLLDGGQQPGLRPGLAHRLGDGDAEADPRHRRPVRLEVADADRPRDRRYLHRPRSHRDPQPRRRPLGGDGLAAEQRQLGERPEELRPGVVADDARSRAPTTGTPGSTPATTASTTS